MVRGDGHRDMPARACGHDLGRLLRPVVVLRGRYCQASTSPEAKRRPSRPNRRRAARGEEPTQRPQDDHHPGQLGHEEVPVVPRHGNHIPGVVPRGDQRRARPAPAMPNPMRAKMRSSQGARRAANTTTASPTTQIPAASTAPCGRPWTKTWVCACSPKSPARMMWSEPMKASRETRRGGWPPARCAGAPPRSCRRAAQRARCPSAATSMPVQRWRRTHHQISAAGSRT